jgi:hypothetical protein
VRAALACVLACACWRSGGGASTPSADPRDDVLAYLPSQTEVVISGDGERARAAPLWRHIESIVGAQLGSARDRFRDRCGYDPLRVERATAGMWHLEKYPWSMVIVVRGIDPTKLAACFSGELHAMAARDGEMWRVTMPYQHPMEIATVGTTAVVYVAPDASATTLRALLASGAPLRRSAAVARLLADVPNDASAWAVAISSPWREMRELSAHLTIDDGVTVVARMTMADARDAEKLRSWAHQVPATLGTVDVAVDGSRVKVRARVTGEQIESMLRAPFKLF